MSTSEFDNKPAILCLHGGGSSGMIFNVQAARIQRCLRDYFTFVFIDAPHECPAGPGILPVFEGCHPFFTWIEPGRTPSQDNAWTNAEAAVRQKFLEQVNKTGQGFVGVMGFSQGTRLATRLLQKQHQRVKEGRTSSGEPEFKFAILNNGSYGPGVEVKEGDADVLLSTPCVHALGKKDQFYDNGKKLFELCYEKDSATLLEFDNDHRLPVSLEDTEYLSSQILRLHFMSRSLGGAAQQQVTA